MNRDPLTELDRFRIYLDIAISILCLHHGVAEKQEYKVWWAKLTDKHDMSTNAAFVYSKAFGMTPMELAVEISNTMNNLVADVRRLRHEQK